MIILVMVILLGMVFLFGVVGPTTKPGNPGARLWDQATQGSDHTAPPGQPPMIPGGPEGVVFADAGTLCSDDTGVLYLKSTDRTLSTGWQTVDTSPIIS